MACPVQGQQLDLTFLVSPFQFRTLCDSVNYCVPHSLNAAGAASVCVGMEWESPKWVFMVERREGNFMTGHSFLRFSFEASAVVPEWI